MSDPTFRTSAASATAQLPPDLARRLSEELEPGEELVWSGQPVPARAARAGRPIAVFGIPWTLFSLYWVWGASQASVVFALFGLPFVAIGIGMLASPWLFARRAAASVYAITDRRVLTVLASFRSGHELRSFLPGELGQLRRVEHPDGTGDVILAMESRRDGEGGRQAVAVGLLSVRDPKAVEKRVKALHRRATARVEPEAGADENASADEELDGDDAKKKARA